MNNNTRQVMQLYRRGKTYRDIARQTGYSVRHIKRLVFGAKESDKILRGLARRNKEHYAWLLMVRMGGYTIAQLAEMCGVSPQYIHEGLNKFRRDHEEE